MFTLSIGIMAYNEEANITRLLERLGAQRISHGVIKEIIVVASGCTDRTEERVRECMQRNERVRLLVQPQREGKASAINLFLSKAVGEILILESGDTLPETETVEGLVAPFMDETVGMTGARPVPVNSRETFIGFSVHLLWALHHQIAQIEPKLGEMVAFRNFVREIPPDTAVDEASIEALVKQAGYRLRYVPQATVINKGPETAADFIKQRRRIAAGHLHLLKYQKHQVSTHSPMRIMSVLLREHTWTFRETMWTIGAVMLELLGRVLGYYDFYLKKKNPYIWDIAHSTKAWK